MLTYPGGLFSEYNFSALRGCSPLKFLRALEIALASAHPTHPKLGRWFVRKILRVSIKILA